MATISYPALYQIIQTSSLPRRMHEGLLRYIVDGYRPGGFLSAVLANDLKQACSVADDENRYLLYDYIFFLYNYAPPTCYGSKENFEQWLKQGGFTRRLETKTDGGNV